MSSQPVEKPTRRDAHLIKTLARGPLSSDEVMHVHAWWLADRQSGEGLAEFLVRQSVFAEKAVSMLPLMEKGYAAFTDSAHLFLPEGVAKVRERIATWSRSAVHGDAFASLPKTLNVERPAPAAAPMPAARPASVPKVGGTLGKYQLTDMLGQGGCGIVFRGMHRSLQVPVAIKVLPGVSEASNPKAFRRFKSEARVLANLNNPNVVRVLDFEDDPACPYLVMEFIEGMSLEQWLKQRGPMPSARAAAIMLQAANGLAAASALGIVHRDVKPGNILLTRKGVAKLADFGLALAVGGPLQVAQSIQMHASQTVLAGTVGYMAPEQARSPLDVDSRADIYSLGATFYHLVTGAMPFTGESVLDILMKHTELPPTPPHELNPSIDERCSVLILRMLAKKPDERFASYAELASELRRLTKAVRPVPTAAPAAETRPAESPTRGWLAWLTRTPRRRPS